MYPSPKIYFWIRVGFLGFGLKYPHSTDLENIEFSGPLDQIFLGKISWYLSEYSSSDADRPLEEWARSRSASEPKKSPPMRTLIYIYEIRSLETLLIRSLCAVLFSFDIHINPRACTKYTLYKTIHILMAEIVKGN